MCTSLRLSSNSFCGVTYQYGMMALGLSSKVPLSMTSTVSGTRQRLDFVHGTEGANTGLIFCQAVRYNKTRGTTSDYDVVVCPVFVSIHR